jgi:hypothetical protein
MMEGDRSGMTTAELFGATWRLWRWHAGMFVVLLGIPIATLLLFALMVNYAIKRGGVLAKGRHGRIALLLVLRLGLPSRRYSQGCRF